MILNRPEALMSVLNIRQIIHTLDHFTYKRNSYSGTRSTNLHVRSVRVTLRFPLLYVRWHRVVSFDVWSKLEIYVLGRYNIICCASNLVRHYNPSNIFYNKYFRFSCFVKYENVLDGIPFEVWWISHLVVARNEHLRCKRKCSVV